MDTLGLVETWNISSGVRIMDMMLKAAEVKLVKGTPICSGRFMIQISGTRDDVATSINSAVESDFPIATSYLLSNVSGQVLDALKRQCVLNLDLALGLVESKKAVSCIAAADVAVKKSNITLGRLTVANGINGKSYLVMGGDLSSVEEAVQAATEFLNKELVDCVVLAHPDPAVVQALVPLTNVII